MIAALIEWLSDYEYDYKFYAMCDGAKFSFLETLFIYTVFAIDLFILFAFAALTLFVALYAMVIVYWSISGLPWE